MPQLSYSENSILFRKSRSAFLIRRKKEQTMNTILHICRAADWGEAQTRGEYRAGSLSAEGFIHCSTSAQVIKTANRFYAGQRDLVLLVIDADRVSAAVKREAADGDWFPHVYGPLNLDAVTQALPFPPAADGTFAAPALGTA